MALTFTIAPLSNANLVIGKDAGPKNKFSFTVKVDGDGEFFVTVKIPTGPNGVFVNSGQDGSYVGECKMYVTGGKEPLVEDAASQTPGETFFKWENAPGKLVNGNASTTYTIELRDIYCTADIGEADIIIECAPPEVTLEPTVLVVKVRKVNPPKGGNPILFLLARPLYLPSSGGDVTLTWGIQEGTEVQLLTQKGQGFVPVSGHMLEEQGVTDSHMYTLKAVKNGFDTDWQRQVYVQLGRSGWRTVPLLSMGGSVTRRGHLSLGGTFPSTIFDTDNGDNTRLYAIFCSDQVKKVGNDDHWDRAITLRGSADGITDWEVERGAGPVPGEMESSPGLRLGNRLWLIGGSAVDPERTSNEIWYSDLATAGNAGRWKRATITYTGEGTTFERRMGHACLRISDTRFWVLGGAGPFGTLNDVWSFDVATDAKLTATKLPMEEATMWEPRCMFGAVKWHDDSDSIWVFGGMDTPNGRPVGGIWRLGSEGMSRWEQRPALDTDTYKTETAIGTAVAIRGTTMSMLLSIRQGVGQVVVSSYMATLEQGARSRESDTWIESKVTPAYDSEILWIRRPLSITAVWFRDRLIVRYLHRNGMRDLTLPKPLLHFYTP